MEPKPLVLLLSLVASLLVACVDTSGLKQSFEASMPIEGKITFTD